ncbi:MAG: winged helix-turn-helix transcriptional regulator [Ignavibacteriae bacterium]|nr:winged helix-turn-helix transcriptional regulator [Ignavibacteriota bacterium]
MIKNSHRNIDIIFNALADSSRRQILTMLTEKEMRVNDIAGHFKFSRPAVSKHLRILQESKLVVPRRDGRERYYRVNAKPLKEVNKWLQYFDRFWDDKLISLKNYIEKEK